MTRLHTDISILSEDPARIADELVVGVLNNNAKMPLFSVEERVKMLKEVTKEFSNVQDCIHFEGLLIDFAQQMEADFVVSADFGRLQILNMSLQMSQTNHKLEPEVETMFLTTSIEYSYLKLYYGKRNCGLWGRYFTVCAGSGSCSTWKQKMK